MTHPVAFLDTETMGLDPDLHDIWEVALLTPDGLGHVWQLPGRLELADPVALEIGRYHDRRWPDEALADPARFAVEFEALTHGLHLAGAVVSFDEERLRRLLGRYGIRPGWSYHLIEVENLAVGFLAGALPSISDPLVATSVQALLAPPWDSGTLSRALGVEADPKTRHIALGDALWARSIYQAVMGLARKGTAGAGLRGPGGGILSASDAYRVDL